MEKSTHMKGKVNGEMVVMIVLEGSSSACVELGDNPYSAQVRNSSTAALAALTAAFAQFSVWGFPIFRSISSGS